MPAAEFLGAAEKGAIVQVLVVDDEPDIAFLIRHTLEGAGLDVVEARDGASALGVVATTPVDLVVMDMGLPDMTGLELLGRFKELSPDMRIIVLTAAPTTSDRIAGLLAGADDYMDKPFSSKELLARVSGNIRSKAHGARASSRLQEIVTGLTSEVTDAVIIITPDLLIHSFNPAAEELYGWPAEEALLRPAGDVLRWVGGEADIDAARRRLATDGSWHGVAQQYRRDGSVITVRASTRVLQDAAGEPLGMISVNRLLEPATAERRRAASAELEIRAGLAAGEFVVHYQPIFSLDDRQVVGVEALVRWKHDDELRMPLDFIGVAEQSHLILDIGKVVLWESCQQLAAWRAAGHDLHLAVNISARQLLDPDLVPAIDGVLGATGMPRGRLTLEVTETALIEDVEQANKTLLRITDLGVGVSIDDFGTGWASLSYLQQFPITCLKIDRSFVSGLGGDRRETAIVRSVLALGRELDLHVIAEGIETDAQLEELRLLGCRLGQGFLVSPARPASELRL
ncbi:MAG: signaling protein [Actinomycetia bacterium]|nr:signaling protein [Actinomycetes bacterium]